MNIVNIKYIYNSNVDIGYKISTGHKPNAGKVCKWLVDLSLLEWLIKFEHSIAFCKKIYCARLHNI